MEVIHTKPKQELNSTSEKVGKKIKINLKLTSDGVQKEREKSSNNVVARFGDCAGIDVIF